MNINVKNIEQLLMKTNESAHEAEEFVDCKGDSKVTGGEWIKQEDIPKLEKIGQPVYMDDENVLLYPVSHDLIIGSTGSGKTSVLYDNYIDFYSKLDKKIRPSMLILDLKGDMYLRHANKLKKKGYKTCVIDMRNAFFSASYNPLATIFDCYAESCEIERLVENDKITETYRGVTYETRAQAVEMAIARYFELRDTVERLITEIAEIFITNSDPKNMSWTEGARNCLKAILYTMLRDSENPILQMTKEKYTIKNVCKLSFTTDDSYEHIINWLRRASDINVVAGALGSCYDIKAQVTRDGYISSLNAELNKYSSLSISAITAKSDVLISDIANSNEDYAIFLITDSRVKTTNNIAMMFINDLINSLMEKADKNPSRALDKDFIILADEMGNLPQVPNMSNKISSLRSRKIWLQMAVQSLEQLDLVYGTNISATIVDNCDVHMFLGCNNDLSKERFAKSMGEMEGLIMSAGIGSGGAANLSVSTQSIPVVRKSDLSKLQLGEFYVRSRVSTNLKSSMKPYFLRTDTEKDYAENKLKYNGFDPDANIYDLKETNALEGVTPEEDSYSRSKVTPKKQSKKSLVYYLNKLKDGENKKIEVEDEEVTNTEYISAIEKEIPPFSVDSFLSGTGRNIASRLNENIVANVKNRSERKDKMQKLKKENLFPSHIQLVLFGSYDLDSSQNTDESWKIYFKRDLLYDYQLNQNKGKETAINELQRRKEVIEKSKCFSPFVADLYTQVIQCLRNMGEKEYKRYLNKLNNKAIH